MARRALRVSTHPITRSTSAVLAICCICACMPCQFRPQKRLIRCASTIALGKPISVRQNGWRTQLVSLTVSGSIKVNVQAARVTKRQHGLVEVGEAGSDRAAVPAATDYQDANRPFQQLGIQSVDHCRPCLQLLQVLLQRLLLDERRNREPLLPCQTPPECRRSAAAASSVSSPSRMGEFALEEGLLPCGY